MKYELYKYVAAVYSSVLSILNCKSYRRCQDSYDWESQILKKAPVAKKNYCLMISYIEGSCGLFNGSIRNAWR